MDLLVKRVLQTVASVAAGFSIYQIASGFLEARKRGEVEKLKAIIVADVMSAPSVSGGKALGSYLSYHAIWYGITEERTFLKAASFIFLYSVIDKAVVVLNSIAQYKALKYYEERGEVLPGWKKITITSKKTGKPVLLFKRDL